MNAFFFGSAERQLFGYVHHPRGDARGAVVICPSWGPEYQYAHRALRVLAKRLAERGLFVLRFDYSGVGDSWGTTVDGNLDQWLEDTRLAIEEARSMSALDRVDLVGLRLGALIASQVAAARSDVRRIVLWDPVTDGTQWVTELLRRTGSMPVLNGARSAPVEFSERLVNPELVRCFTAIRPNDYPDCQCEAVFVLQTQDAAGDVRARLGHIPNLSYRSAPDASPWVEDVSIWAGMVPAGAIAAITDWMAPA